MAEDLEKIAAAAAKRVNAFVLSKSMSSIIMDINILHLVLHILLLLLRRENFKCSDQWLCL